MITIRLRLMIGMGFLTLGHDCDVFCDVTLPHANGDVHSSLTDGVRSRCDGWRARTEWPK